MFYGNFQVHRSFVVNSNFIADIKNLELILTDGETLPIAENRRKEVKAAFYSICLNCTQIINVANFALNEEL